MSDKKLALHIMAMKGDAYLKGHPEWDEIVSDAAEVLCGNCPNIDTEAECNTDACKASSGVRTGGCRCYYVGLASWTTEPRQGNRSIYDPATNGIIDVVFTSYDENVVPGCVYAFWGSIKVAPKWVPAESAMEAASKWLEDTFYRPTGLMWALEMTPQGWGLFKFTDGSWVLQDYYDGIKEG